MTQAIVVTATDTDVGKTVFSAGLVRALDGCYWKPVQAGLADGTDSETVRHLSGLPDDRILPEAYRLHTPASPHHAAAIDNVVIEPALLDPPPCDRRLVIEGAGGLLVPLAGGLLFADIFARWHFETVLVARTALGTINHSLLTIEALRARDIPILGIAFVGDAVEESERTICAIGRVKRLGRLPRLDPLDARSLAAAFAANFDPADFTP
ncbi:dethiobiotin synthase [Rhizorhabdus dicambivorans]|uniref:ATP-dependent dethiobiotin synthetase BioD n=1 Tax=Rhizorhabdus dicambivorans TaxID=1850238 RepID=A0A2A4FRZ4_9SPHN|nr:dethiobiotin synthase [Rhizorhabdus dicambivorans]ATE64466.1 ATP-dependent dethiobiotin synthetase BioD [Rhizorhabdus dicambivorans]PCE41183.1 ATP-dependent dethiobiotin synthetase BioD [Rhizorhabdus dicambivorans]